MSRIGAFLAAAVFVVAAAVAKMARKVNGFLFSMEEI